VGFDSSATDKIRAKATSSESTERKQNQIPEESDDEGRSDVSSDGTRKIALASSQGRERQMDSREDEARWRRSSQERIRPDIYHSQSVIAQRNGKVTNRGRTASCIRESQASASSDDPHASSWRGVTDTSDTVLDHIGKPTSSWRVASPSPDHTGSLHASSWRGAPTVSSVRPDQYVQRVGIAHASSWCGATTVSGVRPERCNNDSYQQNHHREKGLRRRSSSAECSFWKH